MTDVASFARAAEEAGADAVSLVNTFLAMVIDVETRRPKISNGVGGLSGPAIRPIAVRMVHECRQTVKIPVIGMGGIADARDALEFMIAGANAVQIGTANFVDPFIWTKLLDGIRDYGRRHAIERVSDLVGTVDYPAGPKDPPCKRSRWNNCSWRWTWTRSPRRARWPIGCAAPSAASKSAAACSRARGRRWSRSSPRAAIACSSI